MSAAMNGHTETVLALAELGADVRDAQRDGTTAIIKAAVNGRTETVRALAQLGADVHARTNAGATTVMCAAQVIEVHTMAKRK
jgi:ankyrin repeat protein